MYLQLKNGCVIDEVINYFKSHKEIEIPGAIITSPIYALEKYNDSNNFTINIKCDFVTEVNQNYNVYRSKVFEYDFMVSSNRIGFDSETAGNVIKEIIGLVFK